MKMRLCPSCKGKYKEWRSVCDNGPDWYYDTYDGVTQFEWRCPMCQDGYVPDTERSERDSE